MLSVMVGSGTGKKNGSAGFWERIATVVTATTAHWGRKARKGLYSNRKECERGRRWLLIYFKINATCFCVFGSVVDLIFHDNLGSIMLIRLL